MGRPGDAATVDHWVYKAFGIDGTLLYVGITSVGPSRLHQHARTSAWAPLAASIAIEHFDNRPAALRREADLIRELMPPFNAVGNPRRVERLLGDGELSHVAVAQMFRCSPSLIRSWIRAGELPARDLGHGHYAVAAEDADAWFARRSSVSVPVDAQETR